MKKQTLNKTTPGCFTEKELILLRDIIHDYKDSHRGSKEFLVPVMELEKKFIAFSDGQYEPDTTYDWKGGDNNANSLDGHTLIDLGLPSGRLWATENVKDENGNEAYFTFDDAVNTFGNNLPSKEDWKELIDNSSHSWNKERKGYDITGPNGNSILLSAVGFRYGVGVSVRNVDVEIEGFYWSSSALGKYGAYSVSFDSCKLSPLNGSSRFAKFSIRLVR